MKKFFSLLTGIGLILALVAGCQQQPFDGQKLRLALNSDPTTLDPRKATDLNAHNIIRMLYDGLMRVNPNGEVVHSIARHHQISKDGKTYTFYLKDAQWSNGKPVTAFDFEYTWKQLLAPSFPSGNSFKLFVIKNAKLAKEGALPLDSIGVQALNNQTLLVELEAPVPYFLELIAQATFFPVPKGTTLGSCSLSNGPFQLTSWDHNHRLLLKKNPFYWDYRQISLDEIEVNIIPNETTALSIYEEGDLDWVGQPFTALPSDALETLRNKWNIHQKLVSATCWLVFNTETYPFQNENLRKAFSYAINRASLVEDVINKEHLPAYSPIPKMQNFETTAYYHDSMQKEARSYLEKALEELEIEEEHLKITFKYNASEINHRIAQALQNQWLKNLNLIVNLEQNEWKVHLSKLKKHDFEIARTACFADFSDPIAFLDSFKYKDNEMNYTSWASDEYTNLLNQCSYIADPTQRSAILKTAESLFISEMPVAPLYFYSYSFICNKNLKKYGVSSIGEVDFKWAYFDNSELE